ncbi:13137_t:CDS:1, partial [Cetraspora pellucida]
MDTTAELDILNTTLTVLFTSTSVSSLPFATILILYEKTDTLIKALNILKNKMLSTTFGRHEFEIGLQVIITDD